MNPGFAPFKGLTSQIFLSDFLGKSQSFGERYVPFSKYENGVPPERRSSFEF
jgi:hypothetical protein